MTMHYQEFCSQSNLLVVLNLYAAVLISCAKVDRYLLTDAVINHKDQLTCTLIYIYNTSIVSEGDDAET